MECLRHKRSESTMGDDSLSKWGLGGLPLEFSILSTAMCVLMLSLVRLGPDFSEVLVLENIFFDARETKC